MEHQPPHKPPPKEKSETETAYTSVDKTSPKNNRVRCITVALAGDGAKGERGKERIREAPRKEWLRRGKQGAAKGVRV